MRFFSAVRWIALLCGLTLAAQAQDLAGFEKRITTKVLPNGLTLIVCERPEAPVFSYFTLVDAGDANDPSGQSGIAHMSSTWPSKAPKISAQPIIPLKKSRSTKWSRRMRRMTRNTASAWAATRRS